MKSSREVCQLTGISRKTLRGYNDVGLVSPTSITEDKRWLYDNVAIQKIKIAMIFQEAGYSRKKIKEILELSEEEQAKESVKLLECLEKKREKLTGFINLIKLETLSTQIPSNTLKALLRISAKPRKSFKEAFEESVTGFVDLEESELEDAEGLFYVYWITAMLNCRDCNPADELVQSCVRDMYEYEKRTTFKEQGIQDKSERELIPYFRYLMMEYLDDGMWQELDLECGDGSGNFLAKAILVYCNNALSKYMKKKDGNSFGS